ncbi:unnamed protein product [Clonostachys rosea f. rosea IK726]|uniref:Fungal lipase-type domain-containing protein n=2 Tax=Bionectria ochroleuca TaxID=29856 RepID=A0A0B7KM45_BIOOC|nr:unnamed protein product [Clonostachys rosea f. rosea IK726]
MALKGLGVLILSLLGLAKAGLSLNIPSGNRHIVSQQPLSNPTISPALFSELERLSRVVDISYCIGNSGLGEPFNCISRCDEFPTFSLITAWNTGVLMSDSCGYIAVDHGAERPAEGSDDIADANHTIMVAFRGTYSITNTVVDLGTVPQEYVPYPSPENGTGNPHPVCTNCTVHMGFMSSWETTRTVVVPKLLTLREKYPNSPIHLVGHSLGGALACLAALELKLAFGWDNLVVTTFGEPRVGNGQFAKFIDSVFDLEEGDAQPDHRPYRRVTHANDPVPLLPLTEWGYSSHAGEIFISKASLSPAERDVRHCHGDDDPNCIADSDPYSRYKLWELFFAHRDYFWRLGLCIPGGDPTNWGRGPIGTSKVVVDEL